jgi:hypothetical protein
MFEGNSGTILAIIAVLILPSLFVVNYCYQRKTNKFVDEMLLRIPGEYNKQIKSNAFRHLIGRGIWGLFFLSGFILNFRAVIAQGFSWLSVFVISLGIGFVIWGIFGYKSEMKKIKNLE